MYSIQTKTRAYRRDVWYKAKGRVRQVLIEMENLKTLQREMQDVLVEEALRKGMVMASSIKVEGYELEVKGDTWLLTKIEEIKVDKTIRNRITVQLEPWMHMKIPVQVVVYIKQTSEGFFITDVRTRRPNGAPIHLFHTNHESTCWGDQPHDMIELTKENIDKRVQEFKTLMEVVNHYSMYIVDDELNDMKNLISQKYKTESDLRAPPQESEKKYEEWEKAQEERVKNLEERTRRTCLYIPEQERTKEEEGIMTIQEVPTTTEA